MALLKKEEILGVNDLAFEEIEVPEWGGTVRIKTMTGAERDEFESDVFETKGNNSSKVNMRNFRAKLVSKCLVDENGNRIFADADIEALGKKSAKALDRVFAVAQRINAIGQKEVEELTKN